MATQPAKEEGPKRRKGGPETLGSRLKMLRSERKLHQEDLAAEIGISRAYISQIETGAEAPGRDTLVAISNFFDVSLDWLASGDGDRTARAARAQNEREALFLAALRRLPDGEADAHLQLLLKRVQGGNN